MASALASSVMATSSHAQDADLSWPPHFGGLATIGFIIEDSRLLQGSIRVPTPGSRPMCTTMDDPACAKPAKDYGWWLERVLPPCFDQLSWEEYIESVEIVRADGVSQPLEFSRTTPGRQTVPRGPR